MAEQEQEQDNASHGWAGHVKAQSKLGGMMLAMITGIAYFMYC